MNFKWDLIKAVKELRSKKSASAVLRQYQKILLQDQRQLKISHQKILVYKVYRLLTN